MAATKLADVEKLCRQAGRELALAIDFRQSNQEGELVTWIQEVRGSHAGIVINAGAGGRPSSRPSTIRALR